jgi:AcrR family transcriptional regulator
MQAVASPPETVATRRGRPRDPLVEVRIREAALAVYGRQGWRGFNLDVVARQAGVSKDALYRRWRTRDALLEDALKTSWSWIEAIDTGSLDEDLLQLGQATFTLFAGAYGEVALQLRADARRFEEVRAFAEPYREQLVRQGRMIVRRAIERGDPAAAANPGLIMDMVVGAIINHIVSTPSRLRGQMLDNADGFVRDLVAVVTAGMSQLDASRAGRSSAARSF